MKFVDFFFDIPYTKSTSSSENATISQDLPSSTLVKASKYITHHTALSDRQVVEGICNVSYQVGARFFQQDLPVFETDCPVELLAHPAPQAWS